MHDIQFPPFPIFAGPQLKYSGMENKVQGTTKYDLWQKKNLDWVDAQKKKRWEEITVKFIDYKQKE